ncbi:MAG: porphobilinogen synthase [Myxococcota bacterium]
MQYPDYRPRRLRRTESIRRLVRETRLSPGNFIYPLFVVPGRGAKQTIASMPGVHRFSVDKVVDEAKEAYDLGVPAVILFGIPEKKDEDGTEAWKENGVVQQAIRAIKKGVPDLTVITDVCMCEYTSHGHCGHLTRGPGGRMEVDNDATLELLAKEAVSHARAGADIVAPSDMMDGRVGYIRESLDEAAFDNVPILAYSAKYASGFYGPFRDAAESAPKEGDRRGYQMDPSNVREALREMAMDLAEGADMLMVKPALAYLDVLRAASEEFDHPLCAYQVSGEYSMVMAAHEKGWIDGPRVMMETLVSIKRAGADNIITYYAKEACKALAKGES